MTRTKLAATTAALVGFAITLAACSNDNGSPGGNNSGGDSTSAGGAYISITEGQHGNLVVIDGTTITYLSLTASDSKKCPMLTTAFEHIDKGEITAGGKSGDGMYELESKGQITDGQTSVIWDDDNGADGSGSKPGTGSISVKDDAIALEYIFHNGTDDDVLVPRHSDQGKAAVAKYCG